MWDDVGYAGIGVESWYVLGPALLLYAVVWWRGPHLVVKGVAALYAAGVLHFTLFPIDVQRGPYANRTPWYEQVNFVPLLTADVVTFGLNVVMLVPFGVFLATRPTSAARVALWSLAFSASIELAQLLVYVLARSARSVDVNDLVANTLGGVLGFLAARAALRWWARRSPSRTAAGCS
ncbi:VanZ family protein [Saccharothrix syringae]|uniref:VanZ family protein n=1 Tax=Saccharothrix syringae TaxID=103733 RepID=UPI0014768D63|nr:VanZ family protein [Saccharothrix syringae]